MADARVKNMLKQFESVDNMSAGRGKKPELAVKPVMQRFQHLKENTGASNKPEPIAPKPGVKFGGGVKLAGLTGADSVLKSSLNNVNSNTSSNDSPKRVGVPKAFQGGQTSGGDKNNDGNNNNNINHSDKQNGDHIPLPKTTGGNSADKPQIVPKFPSSASNQKPPWSKPPFPTSPKPDNNDKPAKKIAIVPKNALNKNNSISSTSSNSSTSSSNQNTNVSSLSQTPSSPSSSTKSPPPQESGVFDFKSQLRKTNHTSGPPVKRVLSGVSSDSSTESSSSSTTPKASTLPSSPTPPTSSSCTETPSRVPLIPHTIQMRRQQSQTSEEIIERKSDGKKFRKIELPSHDSANIPTKPSVPTDIDLTSIREQYNKTKNAAELPKIEINSSSDALQEVEEDNDDIYCDAESQSNAAPPTPPKKVFAEPNRASERISLIPEMSPEEEGIDLPVYDDTPVEDIYDDGESERVNLDKPKTSTSSEPQSPVESEQERKKRLKEEANAKKRDEKEKREKEKKEREEEKKRKKKEEEELKIRTKFNLTGDEKMVGEGVIKEDAKAGGLNLKVKKGLMVTILRLHSNPPNKWLVKSENQVGYVDSQNIEVDPNIIRQAMTAQTEPEEEFDQPTYDDVPEAMGFRNDPYPDDEDDGEIYEECS